MFLIAPKLHLIFGRYRRQYPRHPWNFVEAIPQNGRTGGYMDANGFFAVAAPSSARDS
jgi:hypothetical protein